MERPEGEGGGSSEDPPGATPAPAAALPAAAPATAPAAADSTAAPAGAEPSEPTEAAALLEVEKQKADESGVNGVPLPQGWVDLRT